MIELDWEPLGAPLGAVVHGLDVRAIDDETWAALDALFVERHVLVFRDQTLTPAHRTRRRPAARGPLRATTPGTRRRR